MAPVDSILHELLTVMVTESDVEAAINTGLPSATHSDPANDDTAVLMVANDPVNDMNDATTIEVVVAPAGLTSTMEFSVAPIPRTRTPLMNNEPVDVELIEPKNATEPLTKSVAEGAMMSDPSTLTLPLIMVLVVIMAVAPAGMMTVP